jgi:hypothetical protein
MKRRKFLQTLIGAPLIAVIPAVVTPAVVVMKYRGEVMSGYVRSAYGGIDRSENKWWRSHYGDAAIIELVRQRMNDAYSIQAKMLDEKFYGCGSLT